MKTKRLLGSLIFTLLVCSLAVVAQTPAQTELTQYIRENYTKREVQVPVLEAGNGDPAGGQ